MCCHSLQIYDCYGFMQYYIKWLLIIWMFWNLENIRYHFSRCFIMFYFFFNSREREYSHLFSIMNRFYTKNVFLIAKKEWHYQINSGILLKHKGTQQTNEYYFINICFPINVLLWCVFYTLKNLGCLLTCSIT